MAFGAAASAETLRRARELEKLVQGVFAHMRAELDWQVETPVGGQASVARALLNLAQIGGARPAHRRHGPASAPAQQGSEVVIAIEAVGLARGCVPRCWAVCTAKVPSEGLHGHWVQARYVHLFVTDAGGRLSAEAVEEKVTLGATIPA